MATKDSRRHIQILASIHGKVLNLLVHETETKQDQRILLAISSALALVEFGAKGVRDLRRKVDETSNLSQQWFYEDILERLYDIITGLSFEGYNIDARDRDRLLQLESMIDDIPVKIHHPSS